MSELNLENIETNELDVQSTNNPFDIPPASNLTQDDINYAHYSAEIPDFSECAGFSPRSDNTSTPDSFNPNEGTTGYFQPTILNIPRLTTNFMLTRLNTHQCIHHILSEPQSNSRNPENPELSERPPSPYPDPEILRRYF